MTVATCVLTLTPTGAATLDRMRELNSRQMRTLLDRIADVDLVVVERAIRIFAQAAADVAAARIDQSPAHERTAE